ncbi:MAG: UvrD-helicase domain-containing protein [Mollicutes bacterium]|nr:UvrD-helicase domain-containing protein [Mollicutes bacterium]
MKKKDNGLNKMQQAAVEAPVYEDILIPAGAGSGKTKTLTERVYDIIAEGKIKPSELLVLTFTNNAAHEMKSRIVGRFAKEKDPAVSKLALEMLSSHVQTFDSFNQYLVGKYATRLGVSPQLSVMDDASYQSKRNELVDEVIQDYYSDSEKRARLISTLKKFTLKSDYGIKKMILDMGDELDKMTPLHREKFLAEYDERFFSDTFADQLFHEKMEYLRKKTILTIHRAYFVFSHFDEVTDLDSLDLAEWKKVFEREAAFTVDYHTISFGETCTDSLCQIMVNLIDSNDDEMAQRLREWDEKYWAPLPKKIVIDGDKEAKKRYDAAFKILTEIAGDTQSSLYTRYSYHGDRKREKEKLFSFQPDVHLLLEMEEEVRRRMNDFLRSTNSFSFSDIGAMSLRLLTEQQFNDVADEVRRRFRYIMVDEYQDTNDTQELFLGSLMKPVLLDGKMVQAHLFCVGDAKQSIYAFRNSNVELFRKRQKDYQQGPGHQVIAMNTNYRSRPSLIDDINYVCSYYMTLDHGCIDYLDPMESLTAGQQKGDQDDNFHIWRLYGECDPFAKKKRFCDPAQVHWEISAILQDIIQKVSEGYLIYDLDAKKMRPCRYGDFVILLRTKKSFPLFRKAFNEAGVKLNEKQSENLQETRSILFLQSLISFLKYFVQPETEDPKHLFLSIARSYAFRDQYSDAHIHELLMESEKQKEDPLAPFKTDNPSQDPEGGIWQRMENLAMELRQSSLSTIFLELLERFHVIDRLYLMGDVDANIQKIESLYQMAVQGEQRGQGLLDFVHLFQSVKLYDLSLASDTLVQSDDAVDMMTIHASKGLQNRIVYMPSSGNFLSKGDGRSLPAFIFSEDLGFQFRFEQFHPEGVFVDDQSFEESTDTLGTIAKEIRKKQDPNIDEHVRLFYVALTRAENEIILVGNDVYLDSNEEVYSMMHRCPHHLEIDGAFATKLIQKGLLSQEELDTYQSHLALVQTQPNLIGLSGFDDLQKDNYSSLRRAYYDERVSQYLDAEIQAILTRAYDHYLSIFKTMPEEEMANFYLAKYYPDAYINGSRGIVGIQEEKRKETEFAKTAAALSEEGSEEQDEEADDVPDSEDCEENIGDLNAMLQKMRKCILEEDAEAFRLVLGITATEAKNKKKAHDYFVQFGIRPFALLFDGIPSVVSLSYKTDRYEDRHRQVFPTPLKKNASSKPVISPLYVNDEALEFQPVVAKRASKSFVDEEVSVATLEYGTKLHAYMEAVDFKNPVLDFIQDVWDRKTIAACLELPPLKEAQQANVFSEYGYYDEETKKTGYIDLLYEKDGVYTIVDYKTSEIDDPAYVEQLHAYRRNVCRLFHVDESKVRLYLVSLKKKQYASIP